MNGAVVVDKPSGWTSHDAVNRLRKIFNTKAVGHLGTLDPLATGVLPVLLNRATRLARFFTQSEKHYEAVVLFGYATDSYDADGTASTNPVTPDFSSGQLAHLSKRPHRSRRRKSRAGRLTNSPARTCPWTWPP